MSKTEDELRAEIKETVGDKMGSAVIEAQEMMVEIMKMASERWPKHSLEEGEKAVAMAFAFGGAYKSFLYGMKIKGKEAGIDPAQKVELLDRVSDMLGEAFANAMCDKEPDEEPDTEEFQEQITQFFGKAKA